MKKSNLIPMSILIAFTVGACSQAVIVPNEVNFTINDLATTDFHTEAQREYVASEDPDEYCYDNEYRIPLAYFPYSSPDSLKFTWKTENDKNAKATKYVVSISEDETFENALTYSSTKEEANIYNLKIDTTYYWKVSAYYGSKSFDSDVATFKTVTEGPRNIYAEGVENIRDVGGYPTESGKTFKQGMLYRTAQFNYNRSDESAIKSAPTAKGKNTLLKELKIKSEIDVRQKNGNSGKDETCGIKSSPLGSSVKYEYLPMKFGGSNIFEESDNVDSIKQFFEYCAVEENYPIAFHCVRGTDRTGALAYALGSLCGVQHKYLLRDYLFSNFASIGSLVRESNISGTSFYVYGIEHSEGETISERTINYLMTTVGVSRTTLESIINILLK